MKTLRRIWEWIDDRTGLSSIIIPLASHLVPPGAKWAYVFGSAILIALIIQVITGIALATSYVPSAGEAFQSIHHITSDSSYGKLLRGMHYFGASAMIVLMVIHMIRVFLTASYKFPRELNWLSGVILLLLTLALGFTGQILRWDQNAVWTVAVGAEQALRTPFLGKLVAKILVSGGTIGSSTLGHFFALHVLVLPATLIGVIGLHLYLVLHNGISEPPVAGEPVDPKTYREKYHAMLKRIGVPFWPDAAWRDIVFGALVVLCIVALAYWIGPPAIGKPPEPSLIKAHPRPDWYLLWYFALLALLPHHAENAVIILFPLLVVVGLLAVPFLSNRGERSLKRRPWAPVLVVVVMAFIGGLGLAGVEENWTPKFSAKPLPVKVIGSESGPIHDGGLVFNTKGCLECHTISGYGGTRGPNLTDVGDRLTRHQIIIRIINGGYNMPAYANNITPKQLKDVTTFLESRKNIWPVTRDRPSKNSRLHNQSSLDPTRQ